MAWPLPFALSDPCTIPCPQRVCAFSHSSLFAATCLCWCCSLGPPPPNSYSCLSFKTEFRNHLFQQTFLHAHSPFPGGLMFFSGSFWYTGLVFSLHLLNASLLSVYVGYFPKWFSSLSLVYLSVFPRSYRMPRIQQGFKQQECLQRRKLNMYLKHTSTQFFKKFWLNFDLWDCIKGVYFSFLFLKATM